MRRYRFLKPHEGPRLQAFLAKIPPEGLDRPLRLNWHGPISDWLVEEVDGELHAAAHVVLSKPMAYLEGLAISEELKGFARARAVHNGYLVAVGLAKRAGCSAIRFVTSERHEGWLENLRKRGARELPDPYRVLIQEL